MTETVESVLDYCRKNGRVCPMPQRWNELYQILPDRQPKGTGWEPALPLILAGWWASSDHEKQERLELHVRWAQDHGAFERIANFLHSLPEHDWHHIGN